MPRISPDDLQGVKLTALTVAEMLSGLALDEANEFRRDQSIPPTLATLDTLIEAVRRIDGDENLSVIGKQNALAAALKKAEPTVSRIRNYVAHIDGDLAKFTSLPALPNVSEARAEEVRKRLGDKDPLELRALALSTAADEAPDVETLHALIGANPSAYPRVAQALDADTKRSIAMQLRYRTDAAGRQRAEDLMTLRDSLAAIADDVGRVIGTAADPIARMAAEGQAA